MAVPAINTSQQDWRRRALCAQTDPELFFPEEGRAALAAKRICARCPVSEPCLEHALLANEHHGVWGGLCADERRTLRTVDHARQAELERQRRKRFRDQRLLAMSRSGLTPPQIARELDMSERTVHRVLAATAEQSDPGLAC